MPSQDVLNRMKAVVGPAGFLEDPADKAPFLRERRELYHGQTAAVVRPANVEEVSRLMQIASETGTPIVPQGGNTGLVGGQIPSASGEEILLSLSRLNRVRTVDAANNTLTAEAGLTLAAVQASAEKTGRLFPLSLASEGSCQLGGVLATNAGGTAVLRYGNARDLVLGLEVVLADGRIWSSLSGLRKDNTGYDLKQLFIGSEGTLGIITAATLKLFPQPRAVETALVGLSDVDAAISLLRLAEEETGGLVTAFELMPRIGMDFILRHVEGAREALARTYPWYALIELHSGDKDRRLAQVLEEMLASALEKGLIKDAAIARSAQQRTDFWAMRENLSDVQRLEGGSIKHDVSVPISSMSKFIMRASAAVEKEMPGIRVVAFGHIGDGNVHFNLSQPLNADKQSYLAHWGKMNEIVHGIVREFGGSISAEHGIGRLKRDEIARTKPAVDMELMRSLKKALDPQNLLNPGKVLRSSAE